MPKRATEKSDRENELAVFAGRTESEQINSFQTTIENVHTQFKIKIV